MVDKKNWNNKALTQARALFIILNLVSFLLNKFIVLISIFQHILINYFIFSLFIFN